MADSAAAVAAAAPAILVLGADGAYHEKVDPSSELNNCGPGALCWGATGENATTGTHMAVRALGGFNAYVNYDKLLTAEAAADSAALVQRQSQAAGVKAVLERNMLDGEYVLASAVKALDLKAHLSREDKASNYRERPAEAHIAADVITGQAAGKIMTVLLQP